MKTINKCYGRKWPSWDLRWNDTADKVWLNLSCDFVPAAPHVGSVNNVRAESAKLKANVQASILELFTCACKACANLNGKAIRCIQEEYRKCGRLGC